MDRISRCNEREAGIWFVNIKVASLLFVFDVAFSSHDFQHALERFAAECEVEGIKVSSFKSKGHGSQLEKGGVLPPGC